MRRSDCFGLRLCRLPLLLAGLALIGCTGPDRAAVIERYTDPQSEFLQIDGVRLHARAEGEGPAILLLHGALSSLHTWDGWAAALRPDYRVIRIDLPPFGFSAPMPDRDYRGAPMAALIDAVLDHYRVESVILVGNSLGGYYAAYYAAHYPARVTALALLGPAGYPQSPPWLLRLAALPLLGRLAELPPPRFAVRRGLRSMYGEPERLDEATVARYQRINALPENRAAMRPVARQMVEHSDRRPPWVREIGAPTLLLWGQRDRWVPPELAQHWLDDLAAGRLVVYPDAGHIAMEEIPRRSVDDLRRFLDAQPPGS